MPNAPASNASSKSDSILDNSWAVGVLSSIPIVINRSVAWPTCITVFTDVWGKVSIYSAKLVSRKLSQGAPAARKSFSLSAWPGNTGAVEYPQLPTTSVVTPCRILLSAWGLRGRVKSEWV